MGDAWKQELADAKRSQDGAQIEGASGQVHTWRQRRLRIAMSVETDCAKKEGPDYDKHRHAPTLTAF